jgi:hypothetical protein
MQGRTVPVTQDGEAGFHKGRKRKGKGSDMKFEIRRRSHYKRTAGSDVLVSKVKQNGSHGLTVRLSAEVMRRMRWRVGDYVILDFRVANSKGWLTVCRDGSDDALAIRDGGRKSGIGLIRATPSDECLAAMFPNCQSQYTGLLEEVNSIEEVCFCISYGQMATN